MSDRYTKSVLTIIAACLLVLIGQNLIKPAHAQMNGPAHVIVDSVAGYALQYAGPLHVECDNCGK